MRKKQKLADAMALSTRLSSVESKLHTREMPPDVQAILSEIDAIVEHVRVLEKGKIIIVPPILRRVKNLAMFAGQFRSHLDREG